MPGGADDTAEELMGRRLTVRYRLAAPDPDTGASTADVIGRLVDLTDAVLRLERRDGSIIEVPRQAVVGSRLVPDRPARARPALSATADELTAVTSRGWPAIESLPLGDWELRASAGFTGRANSVAVHGDPGCPLDEALVRTTSFYRERGARPQAQVVVDSSWESRFFDAGWEPSTGYRGGALVQVADLGAAPEPDPRVTIGDRADDAWLALYPRVEDADVARRVLEGPRRVGFARLGDPVRAIGRAAVTGEWVGLAAVETHPDHRRQGLAGAVVRSLLAWAARQGALRAYLQTMPENEPALALYAPYGFTTHHAYRYLVPADAQRIRSDAS